MARTLTSKADYQNFSFGQFGSRYITTGNESLDGEVFGAITALEESEIGINQPNGDTTLTLTLPAGLTIYGNFTLIDIRFTTGKVLAYLLNQYPQPK